MTFRLPFALCVYQTGRNYLETADVQVAAFYVHITLQTSKENGVKVWFKMTSLEKTARSAHLVATYGT